MLHKRILTQREKESIAKYLQDGEGSIFINVLRYRARRFKPNLEEELSLVDKFLEKS